MLSSNVGEVLIVFLAMMIMFAKHSTAVFIVPLTVAQILWINLITDGLPALALGVDPGADDIMSRKPRDPNENILSKTMLSDIAFVAIVMTASALGIFFYYLHFNINCSWLELEYLYILQLESISWPSQVLAAIL